MSEETTPAAEVKTKESAYPARLYRRRRTTKSKRRSDNRTMNHDAAGAKSVNEAVKLLKGFKKTSFDQTVECCVHLGIDPRQADQQLRGALTMPNGIGKAARVICFCANEKIDDMISTAGSICGAAELVKKRGAREIHVAATHGVFAGKALERLEKAPIDSIIVTDSVPLAAEKHLPKIKVLSVASVLGEAIKRIHQHESISAIFEGEAAPSADL